MTEPNKTDPIDELRAEVATLHCVLGTFIAWMSESAVSPLSQSECAQLLAQLDGQKRREATR
jgi:hypothetical protein